MQPFKEYPSHKAWIESEEFKGIHERFLMNLLDSDDDRMGDSQRREDAWHWFLRGWRAGHATHKAG